MSAERSPVESTHTFRFNSIWLVPLIAAIVAAWMLYDNWAQQGPIITLVAPTADGLEAGKTKVKARNVDVGEVSDIRLSDDYSQAIITVRMKQNTKQMLHTDTKFWAVTPQVGTRGISGLGTILSGAYINMEPSTDGDYRDQFEMLKQAPLSTSDDKGIRLKLFSTENAKLDVGAPVHFRGYDVGYIEDVGFDVDRSAITYRLFIHAPYDALVNSNIRFWKTPGLSVKGSASGVEVRLDSLQTLIAGGISFGDVVNQGIPQKVEDLSEFRLFASKEEAKDHQYNQYISYIFLFNGNIRGLAAGAPVEYHGIRIGTVEEVPFKGFSLDNLRALQQPMIPVLVRIEPQRLQGSLKPADISLETWKKNLSDSFKVGMRATLGTSNLLTGSKVISIDIDDKAKPIKIHEFAGYPVFPTSSDSLTSMQQNVETIMDKLAQLPLDTTVNNLNQTLASANETLQQLKKLGQSVDGLLGNSSTQQLPAQLVSSMQALQQLLQDYRADGNVGGELQQSMTSVQQTLDELKPLLKQLRQHPEALVWGQNAEADPQPKAATEGAKQ